MSLLTNDEIYLIIKQFDLSNVIDWKIEEFPDKIMGYLGDHLKLIIDAEKQEVVRKIQLFVKCMPRFDKWKAEYLKESMFFRKEFVMFRDLFQKFRNGEGLDQWRPKLLFIKEDLFVFEDVSQLGYKMPHNQEVMTFSALKATVKTLARFHAQSYIFEEMRSKELGKSYRIWDDFSEYLQEPIKGQIWRDTGRNAVIDLLKIFSKYRSDFSEKIENVITMLYDKALALMKPSDKYRNAVIHRDLWTNNMFIKEGLNVEPHVLIVDFQTVVYASPMLDLSSLIYFNTTRSSRDECSERLIHTYYDTLSVILHEAGLNIADIMFPKETLMEAYNESIVFGITQAALIVPIVTISDNKREEIFGDPKRSERANVISRTEEFIEIAKQDSVYCNRITELLDEIVEKYVYKN